jgi:SPP1 family predicted phage head-tail adaptor
VNIQRPTRSRGSDSRVEESWATLATDVPCKVEYLSGRELIAAQEMHSEVNARIIMGWRSDLKARMRIVHPSESDAIYNILAVLPDRTLRAHLTLLVSTGANQG